MKTSLKKWFYLKYLDTLLRSQTNQSNRRNSLITKKAAAILRGTKRRAAVEEFMKTF